MQTRAHSHTFIHTLSLTHILSLESPKWGGRRRRRLTRWGLPTKKNCARRVGGTKIRAFSPFRPKFRHVLLSLRSSRGIVVPVHSHGPLKVCVWASLGSFWKGKKTRKFGRSGGGGSCGGVQGRGSQGKGSQENLKT